jgi:tRNA uridine 5-carbamoylmethylation protein Kti12
MTDVDVAVRPTSKITVLLLCGLPAAGKSTLCAKLSEIITNCSIIDYDRLTVLQTDDGVRGIAAWRNARIRALELLRQLLSQKQQSQCILLDDNFYLQSMRKQCYKVCQSVVADANNTTIHFGMVWVRASVEHCLLQNKRRGQTVPPATITKMADSFEPPAASHSCLVLHNNDELQLEKQVTMILDFVQRLDNPVVVVDKVDCIAEQERLQQEQAKTRACACHQLDQTLRQCVRAVATISARSAATANHVRRTMLLTKQQVDDCYGVDEVKCVFVKEFVAACPEWTMEQVHQLTMRLLPDGA